MFIIMFYGLCNDVSCFSILTAEGRKTEMAFQAVEEHEQSPSTETEPAAGCTCLEI